MHTKTFFGLTPSRSEILLGQIWVGGSVTTGNGLMFIATLILEEENIVIHVKYVQIQYYYCCRCELSLNPIWKKGHFKHYDKSSCQTCASFPPFSIQRSLSRRGGEMSLLSIPVLSDFIIYHCSLGTVSEVQFVY